MTLNYGLELRDVSNNLTFQANSEGIRVRDLFVAGISSLSTGQVVLTYNGFAANNYRVITMFHHGAFGGTAYSASSSLGSVSPRRYGLNTEIVGDTITITLESDSTASAQILIIIYSGIPLQ